MKCTGTFVPLAVLFAIVALSGIEYAQAQTQLDTGAPLYMKSVTPVTTACEGALLGAGTAMLTEDGLFTNHTIQDRATFVKTSYIEVYSQSTNQSIGVYNYNVPGNNMITVTVPTDALKTITDNIEIETFTTRSIFIISVFGGGDFVFIDHPSIDTATYKTLPTFVGRSSIEGAYINSDGTFIVPGEGGFDITFDGSPSAPCYISSAVALPLLTFDNLPHEPRIVVQGNYEELDLECTDIITEKTIDANRTDITIDPESEDIGPFIETYHCEADDGREAIKNIDGMIVAPGSGNHNDWQLNPTFGRSWATNALIVSDGFVFNGISTDIVDNFHTDFDRTVAKIGELNTIRVKIYTEMALDTVTLSLGVPEPSRVSDAEAQIMIKMRPDYSIPEEYKITDVIHDQKEDLIDVQSTISSVEKVQCMPGSERECHEFAITFRMTAPLIHDVVAVSATDSDRRTTTTYINDGVGFEGEPILPPLTHTIYTKKGNQHPVEIIHLEQPDRRHNIWHDQHGYTWMKNSYGSWFQLTQADFVRIQDRHANVMTRTHSDFADLIEKEREKARQIFDSESIKKQVGESFSHDAPVRIDKLKDPAILEKLKIAEIAALEYLERNR